MVRLKFRKAVGPSSQALATILHHGERGASTRAPGGAGKAGGSGHRRREYAQNRGVEYVQCLAEANRSSTMPNSIVNYDGSITASPQQLIYPETVEEIQAVLRDAALGDVELRHDLDARQHRGGEIARRRFHLQQSHCREGKCLGLRVRLAPCRERLLL